MLQILHKSDFPKVYALMEESFPREEYRSYEDQLALWEREEYQVYGETDSRGRLWGFLAVWELSGYLFIEHFAVCGTERNRGLGSRLLAELQERYSCPLCLEVEVPVDSLTCRRVGFYERNGFTLNPFPYEQPSLGEGRDPVPLKIMTTAAPLTEEAFAELQTLLYSKVYGKEGKDG